MYRATLTGVVHPVWCDATRYTAVPAAETIVGYGEHLSAPMELDLSAAIWLCAPSAEPVVAFLSLAAAPWRCDPYLRIEMAGRRLWVPIRNAVPVLESLLDLCGMAQDAESAESGEGR